MIVEVREQIIHSRHINIYRNYVYGCIITLRKAQCYNDHAEMVDMRIHAWLCEG